jgi:predicted GIY-YIG superfamily endonuclease
MVYLLCFHQKFHHAKHYLGFAESAESFEKRLACHRSGRGAKLMKAITKAGIDFTVARTWISGDRTFERYLKNRKKSSRLCPLCSANPMKIAGVIKIDGETISVLRGEPIVFSKEGS